MGEVEKFAGFLAAYPVMLKYPPEGNGCGTYLSLGFGIDGEPEGKTVRRALSWLGQRKYGRFWINGPDGGAGEETEGPQELEQDSRVRRIATAVVAEPRYVGAGEEEAGKVMVAWRESKVVPEPVKALFAEEDVFYRDRLRRYLGKETYRAKENKGFGKEVKKLMQEYARPIRKVWRQWRRYDQAMDEKMEREFSVWPEWVYARRLALSLDMKETDVWKAFEIIQKTLYIFEKHYRRLGYRDDGRFVVEEDVEPFAGELFAAGKQKGIGKELMVAALEACTTMGGEWYEGDRHSEIWKRTVEAAPDDGFKGEPRSVKAPRREPKEPEDLRCVNIVKEGNTLIAEERIRDFDRGRVPYTGEGRVIERMMGGWLNKTQFRSTVDWWLGGAGRETVDWTEFDLEVAAIRKQTKKQWH